ncbi:MAG: RND transporter, partial [Oscillospiraceae bacterium]|nr:RND transporter [Oscillospiraceae bacterium]
MNEAKKPGKREWVKTAVIIFLAVLLVLTFFSNTIMNANLPEVAVQYVTSGTISAQIRGQATV